MINNMCMYILKVYDCTSTAVHFDCKAASWTEVVNH